MDSEQTAWFVCYYNIFWRQAVGHVILNNITLNW